MEGEREGPQRGIIPRAVEDIFTCIESDTATGSKYLVRASYLQIYNEVSHLHVADHASSTAVCTTHAGAPVRNLIRLRCSLRLTWRAAGLHGSPADTKAGCTGSM